MKELAELRGLLRSRSVSVPDAAGSAISRVAEVTLDLLGKGRRAGITEAVPS
jgi:hypothetical protein